jgi:FMN phosphatase YigB (HAD superfamily)
MMTHNNPVRLVITDLDNTLYDWVTFFATSFTAMADALAELLGLPIEQVYREFKSVHQHYGNSEQPFAILELPSVKSRFRLANRDELLQRLSGPLRAFNSTRKRQLTLYPGVRETLSVIRAAGIDLVGHTEAVVANSFYRLHRLEIADMFRRLYALDDKVPVPVLSPPFEFPSPDYIQLVPRAERKPNPRLLLDICAREAISPEETVYVGDSLARDVSMAKEAGITAVWAKYGTQYDRDLWKTLVKITHWTKKDVEREEVLAHLYGDVQPDHSIEQFSGLLNVIGLDAGVKPSSGHSERNWDYKRSLS